ncbi:hypothetical protein Agub_g9546, partial [Astrephomene gubernaculifera]
MPKLRLRVASSGATFRLELPPGCTWEGLQQEARRATGLPPESDIALSLNKKTPLAGAATDPLDSLGICNGDVVWLLHPDPLATFAGAIAAPSAAIAAPTTTTNNNPQVPLRQPQQQQTPQTAIDSVPTAVQAPEALQPQGSAAAGSGGGTTASGGVSGDRMNIDSSGGVRISSGGVRNADAPRDSSPQVQEAKTETEAAGGTADPLGLPSGISLTLRRLLARSLSAPTSGAAAAPSSTPSSSCRQSAAPPPPWSQLPARVRCLLLLDCALGEAGLVGVQDLPALASCQPLSLPRLLLYRCPHTEAAAAEAAEALHATTTSTAAGAAGAAAATAAVPVVAMRDAVGSHGSGGDAACAGGDGGGSGGSAAAPAAAAKLYWYCMGPRYLVVHGVPYNNNNNNTAAAGSGGGGSGGGGGGGSSTTPTTVTLHIDLSEYDNSAAAATVTAATVTAATVTTTANAVATSSISANEAAAATAAAASVAAGSAPAPAAAPPSSSKPAAVQPSPSSSPPQQPPSSPLPLLSLLPSDLKTHWRRLKEGLALPLLAAVCRTAGVAAPLWGLTSLPLELQLGVLRWLGAPDLAALSATCAALHGLASEDCLWRPLYDREFLMTPCASSTSSASSASA